jgi:signal transduction histidine kinase
VKRWGIRARVLILALTPSVMILLTLVIYFTYERIAEVEAAREERGMLVARRLVPAAEFALFAGDRATLQRLTDAAVHESEVSSVVIRDAQGEILARSGGDASTAADESAPVTEPVIQTRLAAGDPPEQMQATSAPAELGTITVVMTRAAMRAQQRHLLLIGLALGLAGLMVAIALALLIGNSVTRPVRRLANAMAELGRGERVAPLSIAGGGEFRTLGEGFNRMAARLQADARELEAQIVEATRALTKQKDAAEQATSAKSRFIAAASHDLRQPLHAIGLFTATLERRTEGTELQGIVAELAKAVAAMDRLFHSLLDISRLDAGTLRAEPRAFPLQRLFTQLAAEYSEAAEQKRLRLFVKPTHVMVISDELLLHRILTNLVANAIRYTSTGSVMVCCRQRGGQVQIEVRDSGIGIAPDKQDDIFREFYQIGGAERDRVMGLGLGLAIVSRLARLLESRVRVDSAPGRGSMFSLRLRRAERDSLPAASEAAATPAERQSAVLRVLAVDDDPMVLAGNRALLEQLGCEVATVTNGESAETALRAYGNNPVLVLCDMWLADGGNGIDVLQRLSALAVAPISAILVSGDTGPETMHAARAAGYPLLHKPVSPAKLRAVVMQFAWNVRRAAAIETPDEDPPR